MDECEIPACRSPEGERTKSVLKGADPEPRGQGPSFVLRGTR